MNAEQFRERAELDERLAAYLETLFEEASPMVPDRTANLDIFLALLSCVSVRAVQLWLTHYAASNAAPAEAELHQCLERENAVFTNLGASVQQAADVITAVCGGLSIRPPDEEALIAGLELLKET